MRDVEEAVKVAGEIGFPVMLKSTAGGGGMGLVVCGSVEDVREKFPATQARAQVRTDAPLTASFVLMQVACSHFSTTTDCSSRCTFPPHAMSKSR